jgi:hypothetical protein
MDRPQHSAPPLWHLAIEGSCMELRAIAKSRHKHQPDTEIKAQLVTRPFTGQYEQLLKVNVA